MSYSGRVTRIVAGEYGGRRLAVPSKGTRPTTDRMRESIFSALAARDAIDSVAVLDLFAGSGAMAIEAISRGARKAILVDNAAIAQRTIIANLRALGIRNARLIRSSASTFVARPERELFSLVFIDPPYKFTDKQIIDLLTALADGWLAGEAMVVIERSRTDKDLQLPAQFVIEKRKTVSDSTVILACYLPDGATEEGGDVGQIQRAQGENR